MWRNSRSLGKAREGQRPSSIPNLAWDIRVFPFASWKQRVTEGGKVFLAAAFGEVVTRPHHVKSESACAEGGVLETCT